jgi:predicted transcriptional regulator
LARLLEQMCDAIRVRLLLHELREKRFILTCQDLSCYCAFMAKIKISSKVERREWEALQALAAESNQSISGLLTEAVAEYVRKRRLRPQVMAHLEDSIAENEELGKLLAQ